MDDQWIVIGGWATPPQLLEPVFGSSALYLDSMQYTTLLVNNNTLIPDWKQLFLSLLLSRNDLSAILKKPKNLRIAGWSLGAILSAAISPLLKPHHLCLLSATPSFCRRPGFRHGKHPSILHSMQKAIETNPLAVLSKFYAECGLPPHVHTYMSTYTPDQLCAGLHFLEQATLAASVSLECDKVIFFHGIHDTIVPKEAGEFFSDQAKASFHQFPGGHTFFLDHVAEIRALI